MAEIAGEGLVIPPPFYIEVLISLMLDVSSLSLIGLLHSAVTEKDSGFCSWEGQLLLGYILVMFLMYSFIVLSILVKLWLKSKPLGAGEMTQWVQGFCASIRT